MIETQVEDVEEVTYRDVYPMKSFLHEPEPFLQKIRTTHSHITLQIGDKPAAVLLSADEYQRLLDLAADADFDEALRQGTEDIEAGRTRPVDEVFDEIRAKYAIPS